MRIGNLAYHFASSGRYRYVSERRIEPPSTAASSGAAQTMQEAAQHGHDTDAAPPFTQRDPSIADRALSEEQMRQCWDLRWPLNKMSDAKWKRYCANLDKMDPPTSPEHSLAERVLGAPQGIDAYSVPPAAWHRISAQLHCGPEHAVGLSRAPDGGLYPCRDYGRNPASAPPRVPRRSRAPIGMDQTLHSWAEVQFNHVESFIWQQARFAIRPAGEPQCTSDELWQRICEGKISPYGCLWHVQYETSSVGHRNAVDGSVLGGRALPDHLVRQIECLYPYQFGQDTSGAVHNATKHIKKAIHEFRGAEKNQFCVAQLAGKCKGWCGRSHTHFDAPSISAFGWKNRGGDGMPGAEAMRCGSDGSFGTSIGSDQAEWTRTTADLQRRG